MEKLGAIQIVNKLIKDANLDESTLRTFRDFWCDDEDIAKEILARHKKYNVESLLKIPLENIKYIFMGLFYKQAPHIEVFINKNGAKLRRGGIYDGKYHYYKGPVVINNSALFLKQCISLLHLVGAEVDQVLPKNNEYSMMISLNNGTNYYIHTVSEYDSLWQCLMYRYLTNLLDIYSNQIQNED